MSRTHSATWEMAETWMESGICGGLLAVGPEVAPAHHRLAPGCIVADTASIGQSHGLFHRLLTLSSTPRHLQCPQRAGAAAAGPGSAGRRAWGSRRWGY